MPATPQDDLDKALRRRTENEAFAKRLYSLFDRAGLAHRITSATQGEKAP